MNKKLSGEAVRALKVLDAGGRIEAQRVYPFPHRYKAMPADPKRAVIHLALSTIDALVTARLITPLPAADWRRDRFDYVIPPAGCLAARNGKPDPTDEQLVIAGTEHL